MPKMHLQLVSILKSKQHIVNSEKLLEENIEKQITETNDVEDTHMMEEINNNVVSDVLDVPDCDNINSNIISVDQAKESSEKIQQLKRQLWKKGRIIKEMKTKYKTYKKELQLKLRRFQNKVCKTNSLAEVMSKIFNDDQVYFKKNKKVTKWCNETLLKSYRIKFACGTSGYLELLKQGHPLPSLRTLIRRLDNLKFRSGLIDEIFYFLRIKVSQFEKETDKDCMLVLDEMSVIAGNIYDNCTKEMLGQVTLPDHSGEADEALVFLIAGVASRWKQI